MMDYRKLIIRSVTGTLCLLVLIISACIVAGSFFLSRHSGYWMHSALSAIVFFPAVAAVMFRASSLTKRQFMLLLLFIACIPRILWIVSTDNNQVSDFAVYLELTNSLLDGKGYTLTSTAGQEDLRIYFDNSITLPYTTAFRAPGTSLYGALLFYLTLRNIFVFKLSNVLLSVLCCFLIYWIASASFGETGARYASLIWAFYPATICACSLFGSEILFTFFLLATTRSLQIFSTEDPHRSAYIILAGIAAALTILTRPVLPILAISVLGFLVVTQAELKKALINFAVFMAVLLAVLAPWSIRNYRLLGKPVLICTNSGSFLARHTLRHVQNKFQPSKAWESRAKKWRMAQTEVEKNKEGYTFAFYNFLEALKQGPETWYLMVRRGIGSIFVFDNDIIALSVQRNQYFEPLETAYSESFISVLQTLNWLFYFFLILGSLYSLIRNMTGTQAENYKTLMMLYIYFTATVLAHIVAPGLNRYHFTLMALFAIWCGNSISLAYRSAGSERP